MNQVQDVATVFVPLTVTLVSVINQSVKALGYDQPTDDQAEALQKYVSGRDVFISLPTGSGKSLFCLRFFSIRQAEAGKQLNHCCHFTLERPHERSEIYITRNESSLC